MSSNVFTASSSAALESLSTDIFDGLCAVARTAISPKQMQEIVNKFIYEAASKYKNKFNSIPNWIPNYQLWKKGRIPFFTYTRKEQ